MTRVHWNRWHLGGFSLAFSALLSVGLSAARVAADAPPGRFTTNCPDPGTVYDTVTQLTWQMPTSDALYTWSEAMTYCTNNVAKLPETGWRLPSVKELQTIVDDSQSAYAVDATVFSDLGTSAYWTSSVVAGDAQPAAAWMVNFTNGIPVQAPRDTVNKGSVRCVR
jgi:hypothetical protein